MGYLKPFWSYKHQKSGMRYEEDLCIKMGDTCWWNRPYEPRDWNDEVIFEDFLITML
jgi:hypothetical protein